MERPRELLDIPVMRLDLSGCYCDERVGQALDELEWNRAEAERLNRRHLDEVCALQLEIQRLTAENILLKSEKALMLPHCYERPYDIPLSAPRCE